MNTSFIAAALGLTLFSVLLLAWPVWRNRDASGRAAGGTLLLLVVGLPIAVALLYAQVSTYPWNEPARVAAPAPGTPPAISEMVSGLAERMRTEPTVEGLAMLGRSYVQLQRYPEAVEAYHQAWEMSRGADPEVAVGYAEALILADRSTLRTSAADLLDSVLLQLPDDPRALWYGGLSSAARERPAEAQARWTRLLNDPELPDPLRQVLQQQLAAINAAEQGGAALVPDPTASPGAAGLQSIAVTVNLSPALEAQGGAGGVLFVIAREAGQPGPPVAVQRVNVSSFPAEIELTNDNVMLPGRALADLRALELTARLSATGDALAASGDLYGVATPELADAATLNAKVLIDSVQP